MNIFYVDSDPKIAAQSLVDRHVVKMILETAQLLSTAHHVLDGEFAIDLVRFNAYKPTHVNHPSAIWTRKASGNYKWLSEHLSYLCEEYTHRYGKVHKTDDIIHILCLYPLNIPRIVDPTPMKLCMPDEYKLPNAVDSYRHYYAKGKAHLHKWTNRKPPEWLEQWKTYDGRS